MFNLRVPVMIRLPLKIIVIFADGDMLFPHHSKRRRLPTEIQYCQVQQQQVTMVAVSISTSAAWMCLTWRVLRTVQGMVGLKSMILGRP